jgi:hypothetical protein
MLFYFSVCFLVMSGPYDPVLIRLQLLQRVFVYSFILDLWEDGWAPYINHFYCEKFFILGLYEDC